jgi:hypothetical protein
MGKKIYFLAIVFLMYFLIFFVGISLRGSNLLGVGPILRVAYLPMEYVLETIAHLQEYGLNHGHHYEPNSLRTLNSLSEDLFFINTVINNNEAQIEIRNLKDDSTVELINLPDSLLNSDYRKRYFCCMNKEKNLIAIFTHGGNKIALFNRDLKKFKWIINADSIIFHHRLCFGQEKIFVNIRRLKNYNNTIFWDEGFGIININTGLFIQKWFIFDHINELKPINKFDGTLLENDGDFFHVNDVELVRVNKDGILRNNDILISCRNINAVIQIRDDKVVNYFTGEFRKQHDVDVVNENMISVFNNNSSDVKYPWLSEKHSNIVYKNLSSGKDSIAYDNLNLYTYTEGQMQHFGNYKYFENQNSNEIVILNEENVVFRGYQYNKFNRGKVNLLNWCQIFQ